MIEHNDAIGAKHWSPFGSTGLDDLVVVAVLEDSEVLKKEIRNTLEARQFLVLTPESKNDCLELLSKGCRTFVLDIGLDEMARRVEGLKTLEEIKTEMPTAFCAVITHQDRARYEPVAMNLGADWFSGKSPDEIKALIERIEIEFLRRRFHLAAQPTLVDVRQHALDIGLQARKESRLELDAARSTIDRIRDSARTVLDSLSAGDRSLAEDQLVLLEPDIRRLLSFKSELGDGYGIVISALWNALVNQPGACVAAEQVDCWLDVLESVVEYPPRLEDSVILVDRLESVGFNPDPPGIDGLLDLLSVARVDQGDMS